MPRVFWPQIYFPEIMFASPNAQRFGLYFSQKNQQIKLHLYSKTIHCPTFYREIKIQRDILFIYYQEVHNIQIGKIEARRAGRNTQHGNKNLQPGGQINCCFASSCSGAETQPGA